jgi:hypothetical protein
MRQKNGIAGFHQPIPNNGREHLTKTTISFYRQYQPFCNDRLESVVVFWLVVDDKFDSFFLDVQARRLIYIIT